MTPGSARSVKRDVIGTWSGPWVTIRGHRHFLAIVMENEWVVTTLLIPRIFGYISRGDIVPDVRTTDWYLFRTGAIAKDASKHLSSNVGS